MNYRVIDKGTYQFLAEYHVHRITRMCMDECLVYDTP